MSMLKASSAGIISLFHIHRLNNVIKRRPLLFGSAMASVKCLFADLLIQKYAEKRRLEDLNWKRSAIFFLFGFGYTGLVHHAMYCKFYPLFFGNSPNIRMMVAGQVAFDAFVHSPFLYFPAFYCVKGALYKGPSVNVQDAVRDSLRTYFSFNIRSDVAASCRIWIPTNLLTFTVVPIHLRVPWMALVSFVWTGYLSFHRGESE